MKIHQSSDEFIRGSVLLAQAHSKAKTTGGTEQKMVKQNYSPPSHFQHQSSSIRVQD